MHLSHMCAYCLLTTIYPRYVGSSTVYTAPIDCSSTCWYYPALFCQVDPFFVPHFPKALFLHIPPYTVTEHNTPVNLNGSLYFIICYPVAWFKVNSSDGWKSACLPNHARIYQSSHRVWRCCNGIRCNVVSTGCHARFTKATEEVSFRNWVWLCKIAWD